MAGVRIEDLRLEYSPGGGGRAQEVIHRLSLEVAEGEVLALVGRNGSGKTTLLRAIAGLHAAKSGSIQFSRARRPVIGWMPQDFRSSLYPWWSVERNIFLKPASAQNEPSTWKDELVDEILWEAGIPRFGEVTKLSGGQQQIVAFMRALVRPGLNFLLLDEPFSALDIEHRVRLREVLVKRVAEDRCTAILVSHDLLDVALIADRVAILRNGTVAVSIRNRNTKESRISGIAKSGIGSTEVMRLVGEVEAHLREGVGLDAT